MRSTIVAAMAVAATLIVGLPAVAQVTHTDVPGILNFSQIDNAEALPGPKVGFGGATEPAAMPWLAEQEFATVINLRLATEAGAEVDPSRAAAEAVGLRYLHLPFNDEDPDPELLEKFRTALGDQADQPFYIHCHSATRAAALWMIWRVTYAGVDLDTARSEARSIALKPDEAVAFAEKYLKAHQY
jgi:uncharacterized protein (TIGR01244 family)